jgi:hypothetical protein
MNRLIPLLALAVSILTGCATTCGPETFFKPTMVAPAGTRATGNDRYLYVFAGTDVVLRVAGCGAARRATDMSPSLVCIDVWADEGVTVAWVAPRFRFQAPNGDLLGESVLNDTALRFPGGPDATAAAVTGGIIYFESWKHEVVQVEPPAFSSADFTLQPPDLLINGRQWPTLKFRFRQVTEDVCRLPT